MYRCSLQAFEPSFESGSDKNKGDANRDRTSTPRDSVVKTRVKRKLDLEEAKGGTKRGPYRCSACGQLKAKHGKLAFSH